MSANDASRAAGGGQRQADPALPPRPCVFIQTNPKQRVGAAVAAHALKRNSRHPEAFEVRILDTEAFPFFAWHEGRPFRRDGIRRTWRNDDLQSFTPLRFMPPECMGYRGRALVIDPDIFAVADVWELLSRDMGGAAIVCRKRSGPKGWYGCYASSVMLLDCGRLGHWRCREQFEALFDFRIDYMDWISLKLEPKGSIGPMEAEWNDFDRLTERTKMLHNTRRRTQPWKTGLPIDFTPVDAFGMVPGFASLARVAKTIYARVPRYRRYWPHPDGRQERLFFTLLRECLDNGLVTRELLVEEMRRNHVRHDAFEVMERVRPLAAAA
jgi:hypothetical protein